jgi:hypothetical protein
MREIEHCMVSMSLCRANGMRRVRGAETLMVRRSHEVRTGWTKGVGVEEGAVKPHSLSLGQGQAIPSVVGGGGGQCKGSSSNI